MEAVECFTGLTFCPLFFYTRGWNASTRKRAKPQGYTALGDNISNVEKISLAFAVTFVTNVIWGIV